MIAAPGGSYCVDFRATGPKNTKPQANRLGSEQENQKMRQTRGLDVITTTLKREWFAKIVAGTKRIEYREIKPYWTTRLKHVQTPFRLVLRNGMTPPIPVLTVRIDRVVTNRRNGEYELHIGRVLRVEHWDRKKRKPK
jgi:hypothetical protein